MPQIILGVDPGIADTGYGLVRKEDNGKIICLGYGSIKTAAHTDLADRLLILQTELQKIIKKFQPETAAIEQLFFNKNVKTALVVGQARAVAAYGRADKSQIQKMVKLILGLKEIPRPDDAADALAIAICASSLRRVG